VAARKEVHRKLSGVSAVFLILWTPLLVAQEQADDNPEKPASGFIGYLLDYLNMAGTKKSNEFQPMTQSERNRLYLKTMVNPLGCVKSGFSAGIDQANDKPTEWEQGASGHGKRFANILARIIHIFEDNKSLLCYKHVVETMFAVTKEASECLTIAQHSVCCSQEFFASL